MGFIDEEDDEMMSADDDDDNDVNELFNEVKNKTPMQ